MFAETKFFHKAGEGSGGGGGGSDPHNLGYYADLTALQTAHPTGTDGDFAILGSTDTIWLWDSGTSAWKDTDTKGQVTSVNSQTGAVTLTASDVGALPSNTHIPADPVQADWAEADSTALDYIKNKPTLGTAASANTTDFATAAQGAKADTAIQSVKTINNQSIVGTGNIEVATIDDNSTSSLTATWSANKLNTTVGNIETLLAAI